MTQSSIGRGIPLLVGGNLRLGIKLRQYLNSIDPRRALGPHQVPKNCSRACWFDPSNSVAALFKFAGRDPLIRTAPPLPKVGAPNVLRHLRPSSTDSF